MTVVAASMVFLLLALLPFAPMGQGGAPGRAEPKPPPAKPPPAKETPKKGTAPASSNRAKPSRTDRGSAKPWMEFVWIAPGNFMMGSKNGDGDEKPVHRMTIGSGFYMGKHEVTQAQWQAVMGNNPAYFKGDNLPVEQVSWDDAQKFINKLNDLNDGYKYRLPTEAEWEYACRAGTTGDYSGNLVDMAWYADNSGRRTHPVGSKQPNAFGLYDMHGNVWEWCRDSYHSTYNGAPTNSRVVRGGSWNTFATGLRSANRYGSTPDGRYINYGFRVVAVVRT